MQTIIEQAIRFVQLTFIPILFVIVFIGFLFFLSAVKNPHRARKGYIFIIGGFLGSLIIGYGPLLFYYFTGGAQPLAPAEDATINTIAESTKDIGWKIFNVVDAVSEPLLFLLFYVGIGMWLLAAKEPAFKRLGISLILFSPILWTGFHYAPKMYEFMFS